jgi:hypothetical protein
MDFGRLQKDDLNMRKMLIGLLSLALAVVPFPGLSQTFPLPNPLIVPGCVATYVTGAVDTANLTTYTEAGVSFGSATTGDKIVVVLVTASLNGTTGRTLSSATIGGITATQTAGTRAAAGSSIVVGLLSAKVVGATSGTIAVTFSGGMSNMTYNVWQLVGRCGNTAAPYSATTAAAAALACTPDITRPTRGVTIGGALTLRATTQPTSYSATNMANERTDANQEGGSSARYGVYDNLVDPVTSSTTDPTYTASGGSGNADCLSITGTWGSGVI